MDRGLPRRGWTLGRWQGGAGHGGVASAKDDVWVCESMYSSGRNWTLLGGDKIFSSLGSAGGLRDILPFPFFLCGMRSHWRRVHGARSSWPFSSAGEMKDAILPSCRRALASA